MTTITERPALTVMVEPIFVRDEECWPATEFVRTGRSRLIIEGTDELVAVLRDQAVQAAEHVSELALDHREE